MAAPTFHAIAVIDIESFEPRRNPVQAALRKSMYEVLQEACADAHIDWDQVVDLDRGNGTLLLIPPATSMVDIVGGLVAALDASLAEKARMLSESHRMRFLVALHQGLCQPDGKSWVGAAINTARDLVAADALHSALTAAREARMALIVSDEIYQNVVSHEYRMIDAASFAPVLHGGAKAWIRVPGRAYPPGVTQPPADGSAGARSDAGTAAKRSAEVNAQEWSGQRSGIANYGSVVVHGDQIAGDKYQGRP